MLDVGWIGERPQDATKWRRSQSSYAGYGLDRDKKNRSHEKGNLSQSSYAGCGLDRVPIKAHKYIKGVSILLCWMWVG